MIRRQPPPRDMTSMSTRGALLRSVRTSTIGAVARTRQRERIISPAPGNGALRRIFHSLFYRIF